MQLSPKVSQRAAKVLKEKCIFFRLRNTALPRNLLYGFINKRHFLFIKNLI
jgi:hypothetical protein